MNGPEQYKDTEFITNKLTPKENTQYSLDFEEIQDAEDFDELQETAFRLCHEKYALLSKKNFITE